jgi:hypothetical protein
MAAHLMHTASRLIIPSRTWTIIGVVFLGLVARIAVAGEPTSQALNKARRLCDFDVKVQRGRELLQSLHFGSTLKSCQELGVASKVTDGSGREIEDQFALVFRWRWDAGGGVGTTDVAFFFNDRGQFLSLRPIKTDAVFNQPFALADLSIQVVGQVMIKAFEDDMSEADKRQFQRILDNADTKALLEWSLKFQQAAGR